MNLSIQKDELARLETQLKALNEELLDVNLDNNRRAVASREVAKVEALVLIYRQLLENARLQEEVTQMQADESDLALKELYQQELADLESKQQALARELEEILFPPDPRDKKPAYLEIRSGAGGQEASLFAADLLRMYQNYALRKGWDFSVNSSSVTDVGGYREVIAYVKGKDVFKILKHESGVHRVQRVPKTEGAGRIHTSTVTVAVMPEADDVEININPADLRIDVYRSSGAGGQHVNTTDSAVRITHLPTGVVVACQQERSQHKNKERAMKELKSRILQAEQEKHLTEQTEKRKQQIGSGDRSEKIRTYNYPQNRVTDHRIELTLKKLDFIMEGDMDDLVQPMIEAERAERLRCLEG